MGKELFFLTLFSLVILFIPQADAATVTVSAPAGSSVPGCEKTNQCFIPTTVNINIGDTVTWSNDDAAAHTVTSGTAVDGPDGIFDSSLFMAGTSFKVTFDTAGTYDYFCMVHPWMIGTVIVSGSSSPTPTPSPSIPTIPTIPLPTPVSTSRVSVPIGSSVPGCEDTDECWFPSVVTIDVGGKVTWSNDDTAAHTVTSGTAADGPDGVFDSSLFMAGTTFSWTAEEAGEYPYFCMVHPWMAGVVSVNGAIPTPIQTPTPPQIPTPTPTPTFTDASFPVEYVVIAGIAIAAAAGIGIALSRRKKVAPMMSASSAKAQATQRQDDTQFWVCPHCGGDTQYRNEKQFCPSCNMYL